MKSNHLFWGVFLIVLGGLMLLFNYTDLSLDFNSIINFWPIILILIGLRVLIKNKLANSLIVIISAILLALLVYVLIFENISCHHMRFYRDSLKEKRETISQNFTPSIKKSYLTIDYDFGDFKLNTDTQKLINGEIIVRKGNYYFDGEITDSISDYRLISNDTKRMRFFPSKKSNHLKLTIHPEPEWNLNFTNNFVDNDLNLQQINLKALTFESNFSNCKIFLNPKNDNCKVDLEINFSKLQLYVPDSIGVSIETDKNFSSFHYEGIEKVDDHTFQSENFEKSNHRISLNLNSNFSKVTIIRK